MMEQYSIYDHLSAYDILEKLKPLIDSGSYQMRLADGKIEAKSIQVAKDTPWVHVKPMLGFNCGLWHQIIFNVISNAQPDGKKFVPRHCQQCWKVVCKPRTLKQLFNLHELQKKLDLPSKAGIEVRDTVHGLYGGYFYNRSLEAGIECYNKVSNAIKENDVLKPLIDEVDADGRTTRLLLKRACTEFEHAVGPSNDWVVTDEQNVIEDLVERYLVSDELNLTQPEHLLWNIKRRWIEWAWKNGDETYAEYTNGKPLYPAYVTYHQADIKGVEDD